MGFVVVRLFVCGPWGVHENVLGSSAVDWCFHDMNKKGGKKTPKDLMGRVAGV